LCLPGSIDAPKTSEPTSPWSREARRDTRTVVPPSPARAPSLALTAHAGNGDGDLSIDGRLRTERGPVQAPARASGALNDVHVHRRKPVVIRSITDRSGDSIRKLAESALREHQLFCRQDRVGSEPGDVRNKRVSSSTEPVDLNRIQPGLADVIPCFQRAL